MTQSRRQQHEQREQQNKPPVGDVLAVLPYVTSDGQKDSKMVELGPVWESKAGNLTFRLQLWPLQWDDPNHDRVIVIKMREPK